MSQLNLGAAPGVAVREFPLQTGFADYLLFVDRQAAGVIEAKPVGTILVAAGVPDGVGDGPQGDRPTRKTRIMAMLRAFILASSRSAPGRCSVPGRGTGNNCRFHHSIRG